MQFDAALPLTADIQFILRLGLIKTHEAQPRTFSFLIGKAEPYRTVGGKAAEE